MVVVEYVEGAYEDDSSCCWEAMVVDAFEVCSTRSSSSGNSVCQRREEATGWPLDGM